MLPQDSAVYEFDSVRVDSWRRTVELGGQSVSLPSRAFDVLLLMVRRRGQVVTKDELLASIWTDTHVEESSLPVMISAIRRAIGDDGRQQKYIQTVSRQGYRFQGDIRIVDIAIPDTKLLAATQPARHYYRFYAVAGLGIAALLLLFPILQLGIGTTRAASATAASKAAAAMWCEKGRYAWNLQTKAGLLQSIEYYQKAIAENSASAMAYAGLAEAYVSLPSYSERPGEQVRDNARSAVRKALALDDRLAESHIASGMLAMITDRDLNRADKEFRRAIVLDPGSPLAQGELAMCLVAVGRSDEAVDHARQAKALDPLSIRAATDLGIVLYYGHRFAEAEAEFEEALRLNPYSYRARINLGKTWLSLGKFDDARRVLEEASALANHDPLADGLTAEAKALGGDIKGAESILAGLERRARTSYVAPIGMAFALAGLGQPENALVYLRKARADGNIAALFLRVEPAWGPLHDNRDFSTLIGDIALTSSN